MGRRYSEFTDLCTELAENRELTREYVEREFIRTIRSAEKTPFYKSLYSDYGISFSSIKNIEDLPRLPTIDKISLKENFEQLIVPGQKNNSLYLTTGGSTGTPVGFLLEKGVSRAKETAFLEHIWSTVGYHHGDRIAIIRGIDLGRGRLCLVDAIKNALMLSSYHITESNIDLYLDELNKYKPKFIHAYPSAAYSIARILRKLGKTLDFSPVAILCGSENLYDQHVKLVEDVFKTKVLGWYGHAERVLLAIREQTGQYSFFSAYGIAELLTDDGQPMGDGAGTGILCGTSLHNEVMPLVRYMTDDTASGCRSVDGRLVVSSLDGRRHEFVYSTEDRPVSMAAINIHSDEFDSIERFQFVQSEKGAVTFEYASKAALDAAAIRAIEKVLTSKLGDGFDLKLIRVKEIPLTKSGKQTFLRQEIRPTE